MASTSATGGGAPRLDILKALGDNTRYAIYLELARSPHPVPTAHIAETLGLHPNTIRPHLERIREVGLLDVRPATAAGVGRPQHLYSLADDAPGLGLEPPAYPMLARMLLSVAAEAGLGGDAAAEAGRGQGRAVAGDDLGRPCLDAAVTMLARFGFDPETLDGDDGGATIAFTHCPFAELAEANPELVCSLHRGLVEGFVDEVGGATVAAFHDRSHREPCLVELEPT